MKTGSLTSDQPALLVEAIWYLSALLLIVAVGLLNLYLPFVSDQIATMMGARTLSDGGTLYIDFWDNKMPGLYWFYWVAGELFGYTERGIHTLDLIWMTAFTVVLAWALRPYFIHPWLSAVAPLVREFLRKSGHPKVSCMCAQTLSVIDILRMSVVSPGCRSRCRNARRPGVVCRW